MDFHVGSVLPIEDITCCAHDVGAKVLVDACQSVPHMVVDVQNLNADFLVASSHKVRMYGPMGILTLPYVLQSCFMGKYMK